MSRSLHKIPGGLSLSGFRGLTADQPSRFAGIPPILYLPLQQHIGMPSIPVVESGDKVVKGQLLARPDGYVSAASHAPVAGRVQAIENYAVAGRGMVNCIVLETESSELEANENPTAEFQTIVDGQLTPEQMRLQLQQAGIIGLGGAGFPSHVKLREGQLQQVKTLVINAVECEPYITSDDRLMRERAEDVISGAYLLQQAVEAEQCLLILKQGMTEAESTLNAVNHEGIELVCVPAIYPAGGERQIIRMLTGEVLDSTRLPIDLGYLIHNVATIVAVHDALCHGQSLTSRTMTVSGDVQNPQNLRVLIGTPISFLLDQVGRKQEVNQYRLLLGGPMMGHEVTSEQVPVTKTTNCLLVLEKKPKPGVVDCIRCGECVAVCPAELPVQTLYERGRLSDLESIQAMGLFDCIECACCDVVCPSHLPLTPVFRQLKRGINQLDSIQKNHQQARQRFNARRQRLAMEKIQNKGNRSEKITEKSAADMSRQDAIQAAINRSKSRKKNLREQSKDENS